MGNIKSDSIEIIRRWRERNPEIFELIKDKKISLEDFAEIVITQYMAFNNLRPNKNVKVPKYIQLTEGYDPDKLEYIKELKRNGY